MDKELLKFLVGETNVWKGPPAFTRDRLPNGMQYIRILSCLGEEGKLLYDFWYNPTKKMTTKADEGSVSDDKNQKENGDKAQCKNTGGKKPYLMLMISEVEELRKQSVKNVEELIGHLVCLGNNIEWNTGRLIHKRSKKPLMYKDLLKIYSCGNRKLNKLLAQMREYDLLQKNEEGYFISTRLIKKGKANKKRT